MLISPVATPGLDSVSTSRSYPAALTLTGTVVSSGTTVTGTGTKFLTELFHESSQVVSFPFVTASQGNWNASTNSPALTSGTGTVGFLYTVNVAGNTNLDGNGPFAVGDKIAFYDGRWRKASLYGSVQQPLYKFLYSAANCEIRSIVQVLSDTTLIVAAAFTAPLAAEGVFVPNIRPIYKLISVSSLGATNKLGTPDAAAVTLDQNSIVTYNQEGGLQPICVDGSGGGLQIETQI